MPSTTIHFPDETLEKIDAVARRRGVSRNRFVIEACEEAVAEDAGEWPKDFFDLDLSEEDLRLLRTAGKELEETVVRNRQNRGAPIL
jgi:predicted transcriptional regulator